MTDQTPFPQVLKEPRLHGVVDVLRPDRVAGWVIDRTDPARCATVDIRREGRPVGSVSADRHRKDLERQAVGTGSYGFAFTLDPPLEEGMEFTVAVTARSHDGIEMTLPLAAGAARAVSPDQKALGRILCELAELRADIASLRQEARADLEARTRFQERLELVQLRLETSVSSIAMPVRGTNGWLAAVAGAGAAVAIGSVAVGLLSLW